MNPRRYPDGRRRTLATEWQLGAARRLAAAWLLAAVPLSAPAAIPSAAATGPAASAPAAPAPAATPGVTAAGLYNLANSYARAGKPGLAVLNYERSRLLAPGDADVEANEHHVRDSVRLPSPVPSTLERYVDRVPPTVAAWIGVFGLAMGGVALVAATGSRRSAGVMLGTVAVALPVYQGALLWPTLREGVVVTGSAPVLVSPVPMGDPLFSLTEAETVKITARHEGYVLVITRTGRSGWVALTNLVPVLPGH